MAICSYPKQATNCDLVTNYLLGWGRVLVFLALYNVPYHTCQTIEILFGLGLLLTPTLNNLCLLVFCVFIGRLIRCDLIKLILSKPAGVRKTREILLLGAHRLLFIAVGLLLGALRLLFVTVRLLLSQFYYFRRLNYLFRRLNYYFHRLNYYFR